jgi:hypothetical protein
MSDPNYPKHTPQFTTAEYSGTSGGDRCASCKQPITARYYRVNGRMVCEGCAEQLRQALPQDSHASYVRSLLFGIGAALVGLALYAGFTIVTQFYIGYVSLAVGWLIAKAMLIGSKGMGGKRYQITAVLLTYAAVSLAAIPIALASRPTAENAKPSGQSRQLNPSTDAQPAPQEHEPSGAKANPRPSLASILLTLLLIGLASPFLELQDPLHGLIGLVILFVGIQIAWKMMRGTAVAQIDGPYDNTARTSV